MHIDCVHSVGTNLKYYMSFSKVPCSFYCVFLYINCGKNRAPRWSLLWRQQENVIIPRLYCVDDVLDNSSVSGHWTDKECVNPIR